jgi:ankyrin repeat protein
VINGDMQRLHRLLALDTIDVNEKDSNTFHGHGATPLHYGAKYGRLQCVELLLLRGANIEACDSMDATPLHWAALWGHEDVVSLLVMGWKADRLRKTNNGETALDIARRRGHHYIVSLLAALDHS